MTAEQIIKDLDRLAELRNEYNAKIPDIYLNEDKYEIINNFRANYLACKSGTRYFEMDKITIMAVARVSLVARGIRFFNTKYRPKPSPVQTC